MQMSHTDKTDPYFVKLNRYGIEDHDHRNGVCDYVPRSNTNWWNERGICRDREPARYAYREPNSWFQRPVRFGEYRTMLNRIDRRRAKEQLRGGADDVAPPKLHSRLAWWW